MAHVVAATCRATATESRQDKSILVCASTEVQHGSINNQGYANQNVSADLSKHGGCARGDAWLAVYYNGLMLVLNLHDGMVVAPFTAHGPGNGV